LFLKKKKPIFEKKKNPDNPILPTGGHAGNILIFQSLNNPILNSGIPSSTK
jgi:hypothetical protein